MPSATRPWDGFLIVVVVFMRGGLWGGFTSVFERIKGSRKSRLPIQEEQP